MTYVALMLLAAFPVDTGARLDGERLRPIKARYEANQATFQSARMAFEIMRPGSRTEGRLWSDRANGRYEWAPDPKVGVPNNLAARAVTDGSNSLLDLMISGPDGGKPEHNLKIARGLEDYTSHFPLSICPGPSGGRRAGLAADIDRVLDGGGSLAGMAGRGETGVVVFTLRFGPTLRTYHVDLDRGAIPILMFERSTADGFTSTQSYRDLIHYAASGGGWYPSLQVWDGGPRRDVQVVTVRSLEVNVPIADQEFALGLDPPEGIVDELNGFWHEPRSSWSLNALPSKGFPGSRPFRESSP